jgi:beta-glucosidase
MMRVPFPLVALCGALFAFLMTARGQSLDDRIEALLGQMTLEEKVLQLHGEGNMNTADNRRLGIPGLLMDDGPHGVRA